VVSPITLAECLVLPYTLSNSELVGIFLNLMVNHPSILFFPIDESTAEKAAELRAHYHLSLTDAFQIAIAIQTNCDAFLTNDMDLMRVTEIPIIVVSE
jgi:predicted nucleic acid-binding protein